MRPTFFGLEIAKTGLFISQKQLDITGHNIANVETEGYSRQRVETASIIPLVGVRLLLDLEKGRVGGGVEALTTRQIRDIFLDRQYRTENSLKGMWELKADTLSYITKQFDELSENSLAKTMEDFIKGMNALSKQPEDVEIRSALRQNAIAVATAFNSYHKILSDEQRRQNISIDAIATDITRMAQNLADLNEAIFGYEMAGEYANDLRDKRNLILDKLSYYGDITYTEASGQMVVNFAGQELVNHVNYNAVVSAPDARGMYQLSINGVDLYNGKSPAYVTGTMNQLAGNLAALNLTIYNNETASGTPDAANRNARALLLQQLSALGAVATTETAGQMTITVNGQALVTHDTPAAAASVDNGDGTFGITIGGVPAGTLTYPDTLHSGLQTGELRGRFDMRDGATSMNAGTQYYLDQLNAYCQEFVKRINDIHVTAWTLPYQDDNGLPVDSQTGLLFFTDGTGTGTAGLTAGNMRLSQAIIDSVYQIGAASEKVVKPYDGSGNENAGKGDGTAALRMAGVLDLEIGGKKLSGVWHALMSEMGVLANNAVTMYETRATLVQAVHSERLSIMGVSLDEEMTNLVRFNHAYSASSRVITTLDEALDKLINGTGRVGL